MVSVRYRSRVEGKDVRITVGRMERGLRKMKKNKKLAPNQLALKVADQA